MADMVRPERSTSRRLAQEPTPRSPLATWPRPTGPSAGPVLPNGIATFYNEMRPPYRLGQEHPNPGRFPEGGAPRRIAERQAVNQLNPNRFGIRGPLPGEE